MHTFEYKMCKLSMIIKYNGFFSMGNLNSENEDDLAHRF